MSNEMKRPRGNRARFWRWRATSVLAWLVLSRSVLAGGAMAPNPTIAGYVAEARATARAEYDVELLLDTRDIEKVASILSGLRARHARGALPAGDLAREVRRWGAVLGEIMRSRWTDARWDASRERNRASSFSVYIPLESGGWHESNEFDLVEAFITKPSLDLTIDQALRLHFVD